MVPVAAVFGGKDAPSMRLEPISRAPVDDRADPMIVDSKIVPVYEVVATGDASGLAAQLAVDYYRVDTLEPVTPPEDDQGHEPEGQVVQQVVD